MLYQPLDEAHNEIRLLTLRRISDHRDTDSDHLDSQLVSCKLRHYSLDDHPYYMALSYFWGDPEKKEIIIVDEDE